MNAVYIAGRYAKREEFKPYREQLKSLGVDCTSTWLNETADLNVNLKYCDLDESAQIAMKDIEDIDRADAFVFFAEDSHNQPPRGGRHVEFGYALARGKSLHVIGDRENIFHYLPGVNMYRDWNTFAVFVAQTQPAVAE